MPSFRGEDADETHLNQFFHSEVEVVTDLVGVMEVAEAYVRHLTAAALEECGEALLAVIGDVKHLESMVTADPFVRLTLDEAQAHLKGDDAAVRRHPGGFRVLTRHGEHRLLREISPWVWVTHFDHLSVPFYQAYADDERKSALNADLLFGPGEIVGAGERHVDDVRTRAALAHHGVDAERYEWYVRMKAQHPLRTSGFGLGIERWMMWVLQHEDIRDLQILPRYNGICTIP